jgi:hypothetical protein
MLGVAPKGAIKFTMLLELVTNNSEKFLKC